MPRRAETALRDGSTHIDHDLAVSEELVDGGLGVVHLDDIGRERGIALKRGNDVVNSGNGLLDVCDDQSPVIRHGWGSESRMCVCRPSQVYEYARVHRCAHSPWAPAYSMVVEFDKEA